LDRGSSGLAGDPRRAPGLKTIDDATEIRRRFLLAFESAEREADADARRSLLTFIIVGAGPTGVELAGAMAEIARQVMPTDFRAVDTSSARVLLLEGLIASIGGGDVAQCVRRLRGQMDVAVIWARCEDDRVRGFLVEKGTKGFKARDVHGKLSLRASITGAIFLEDVVVPEANMLPGSTVGIKAPLSCLTQARYGITWGVIGAAQACLAQVLDYSQSRVLFGRPLAATQTVQIRLAEMARGITTAQLLSLQLGRLKDQGKMSPSHVSLAKWNNCRMALDTARDARDILGGAGISAEYVPIRHALNLESVITYEGTETIHELIVGRELTGVAAF